MSPPPVTQGTAARRPGAGAGWAGPRRWPGASGPWPTGAGQPGPPGAAWPMTMTITTCPITSQHAGPPGAQAVRTAAAWWRRARADGRANGLGAASTAPIQHCRPADGPDAAGYDGYDAAADTRVPGPLDAEPGTGPFGTGGYDADSYEPGTGPLGGYGAEPSGGRRGRGDRRDDRRGDTGPGSYRPGGGPTDGPGVDPTGGPRHGRDTGSRRGRGPAREGAYEGSGARGAYPEPDRYSPAEGYSPATARGHARPGGRRRATGPASGPAVPGDPGGPSSYEDAPTALTDSTFASAGPEPGFADPDAQDTGEQHRHGGRRRITKVQKPQLRLGRSRQDYDNDPWPSADEVDGVPDDQYWSDLSSDKPLATTARAAQNAGDDEPWAPGASRPGSPSREGGPDVFSAPVEADAPTRGRGRRARAREEGEQDSTEPRPLQQPGGGTSGRRRRAEPERSPRSAEEDPLTRASFSRHARESSDSRSYRGARQAQRRPSHGRPDPAQADTPPARPGPRGYGAAAPAGAQAPGRGSRGLPPGSSLPPGTPGSGGPSVPPGGFVPPARLAHRARRVRRAHRARRVRQAHRARRGRVIPTGTAPTVAGPAHRGTRPAPIPTAPAAMRPPAAGAHGMRPRPEPACRRRPTASAAHVPRFRAPPRAGPTREYPAARGPRAARPTLRAAAARLTPGATKAPSRREATAPPPIPAATGARPIPARAEPRPITRITRARLVARPIPGAAGTRPIPGAAGTRPIPGAAGTPRVPGATEPRPIRAAELPRIRVPMAVRPTRRTARALVSARGAGRSSNARRPDDPYEDPYGRPDGNRY